MSANFDELFDKVDAQHKASKKDALSSHIESQNKPKTKTPFAESSFDALFDKIDAQQKSPLRKAGRIAGQVALGAAENALLPYELAVAPLNSESAMRGQRRLDVGGDIEDMLMQKAYGAWTPQDEEQLESLYSQVSNPKENIKPSPIDISVRGLAEKVTGADLQPQGIAEKAANWIGFLKDPKKIMGLAKSGIKIPEMIKAIAPSGKETLRGLGAGAALQLAEEGEYGPIGTMAAAVAGDLMGVGLSGAVKAIVHPKKTLSKAFAAFTPKEKLTLQKEIIKDFRDSGIQADLGTLTDSNLVKWTQSRLSQSGLTGKSFKELKETMTTQIKEDYKELANSLGESKFATLHEAGETAKEGMNKIREQDLSETRKLYENANKALKEDSHVNPTRVANSIEKIQKELKPGTIKSTEQKAVLEIIERLKQDIYDEQGNLKNAKVKDLMNDKIALNDIINYEIQGGTKQLLKGVVADVDRAIISHGKENPTFVKNYVNANKRFSQHAKTFRNKSAKNIFTTEDPAKLMNRMNSVHGIREMENILSKTPEGSEVFSNLKRFKLDEVIGNNLVDSSTQQIKLGTFSKLLEKGKNREIIREVLGAKDFKRLEKLQKNVGVLASSGNEFYNASKSGVVAADAAIIGKMMSGFASLLMGNPWPLLSMSGGVMSARKLSRLMSDPEFLRLTEEVILASKSGSQSLVFQAFEKLRPYVMYVMNSQSDS